MKIKSLLLMGLSVGMVGLIQQDVAQAASSPWVEITDKSVPRTDFVDISSHNGVPTVAEFKILKSHGVKGVMVKLTEATSYRNPYAGQQIANAKAAGLQIGGYHYSWYSNASEARVEGRYFARYAKDLGLSTDTPMADDLEEPQMKASNTFGRVNNNVKAFREGVSGAGYKNNVLYTYASYANETNLDTAAFGKRNVWMASYPFTPSKNSLWHSEMGMWQFNDNMHFPGVRGTFDANIDYAGIMSKPKATPKPAPKTVKPTPVKKYFKFDQSSRKDGMYLNAPYRYDGAKNVGKPTHGDIVWVEQQEMASNGVRWYLANVNGQKVWFDANAGSLLNINDVASQAVNATYVFDQSSRKDGLYTGAPYGYVNAAYNSKAQHNVQVKVDKQVTHDGLTWFYGTVNGQKMWFDSKAVKPVGVNKVNPTSVKKYFAFNQTNRKDGLYLNAPYRYDGAKNVGKPTHGTIVWVEQQEIASNGVRWYLANVNGQKVWFDAKAGALLNINAVASRTVNATYVFDQSSRKDSLYKVAPYGYANSVYNSKAKHGVQVKVDKQATYGGVTWFYGTVNGQKMWFDSKAVKPVAVKKATVASINVTAEDKVSGTSSSEVNSAN